MRRRSQLSGTSTGSVTLFRKTNHIRMSSSVTTLKASVGALAKSSASRETSSEQAKLNQMSLIIERIGQMAPYRDQFIEFCYLYAALADTDERVTPKFIRFLSDCCVYTALPETMSGWSDWYFEPHQFIGYEWVLYLLSTLIHNRKYATASRFDDDMYQYRYMNSGNVTNTGHRRVQQRHARTRRSPLDLKDDP